MAQEASMSRPFTFMDPSLSLDGGSGVVGVFPSVSFCASVCASLD